MTDLTQTVLRNIMVSTYSAEASVKRAGDFFDTEQQAVERFAWLPTETNTGEVVWLCKYIEVRYYLEWRHRPRFVHGHIANRFTVQDYVLHVLQQEKQHVRTD